MFPVPLRDTPNPAGLAGKMCSSCCHQFVPEIPQHTGTLILLHNGSGGGILRERKAALPRMGGSKGRDYGKSKNKEEGFRWGGRQMRAKQSFQSPGEHLQHRLM